MTHRPLSGIYRPFDGHGAFADIRQAVVVPLYRTCFTQASSETQIKSSIIAFCIYVCVYGIVWVCVCTCLSKYYSVYTLCRNGSIRGTLRWHMQSELHFHVIMQMLTAIVKCQHAYSLQDYTRIMSKHMGTDQTHTHTHTQKSFSLRAESKHI